MEAVNLRRSSLWRRDTQEESTRTEHGAGSCLYLEEGRMQLTSNGQVQRSAAEWSNIITRYRQSGMGSRQFCEQEGLTLLRTFEKWYGRIRRSETRKGQFVEVPSPGG